MVQEILEKSDISKIETRVVTGAPAFEGRLNEGLRLQRKHRDKNEAKQSKTKQNERNTREKTSWHLQTERPEDTSSRHLGLVNKGERTSTSPFTLGYPLLGPSRHVRAYHCVP